MSDIAASAHIWLPGVIIMVALIVVSGFFSSSETALFFLSRDQVRQFRSGNSRQRLVAALLEHPDRLLTAVLFWNLLVNLAYFAVGIVTIGKLSAGGFRLVAALMGLANLLGMIVFGEVVPKSVAVVFRTQLAPLVSAPLAVAVGVLRPVIPLLNSVAAAVRRAFWPEIRHESQLAPRDLENAVDSSAALSTELLDVEQQILHNILDLNEIGIEEVMRPRMHTPVLSGDARLRDIHLPSTERIDYVLLHRGDDTSIFASVALNGISRSDERPLSAFCEPVVFVPWCAKAAYVLGQLQTQIRAVAVVVHEHGEVVGAVTYEDLLATAFSEVPSRTRRVLGREPLLPIGGNRYHVDGIVTLRYLARRLKCSFDSDSDSSLTVAGLFHDELQRLPKKGDSIRWEGWTLTAIDVTPRGMVRALVSAAPLTESVGTFAAPTETAE